MSDVPRIRYVLPKFKPGYNQLMKTLMSALKYESGDPSLFRLKVLEYGQKHGIPAATEAYAISRRTYFYWQRSFKSSQGKLVSLVPKSTRPTHTRKMQVDERLLALIKAIRTQYGRVGKYKLQILVSAYAQSLGIKGYGSTKIGKLIKRHHYFFDAPRTKYKTSFTRSHIKRVGKDIKPGYL